MTNERPCTFVTIQVNLECNQNIECSSNYLKYTFAFHR